MEMQLKKNKVLINYNVKIVCTYLAKKIDLDSVAITSQLMKVIL